MAALERAMADLAGDLAGVFEPHPTAGPTPVASEVFARLVRKLKAWRVAAAAPTPTTRATLAAERLADRVRARASRTSSSAGTTHESTTDIQE